MRMTLHSSRRSVPVRCPLGDAPLQFYHRAHTDDLQRRRRARSLPPRLVARVPSTPADRVSRRAARNKCRALRARSAKEFMSVRVRSSHDIYEVSIYEFARRSRE